MNDQLHPNPEAPVTEAVTPGPVALTHPMPAQARWARIGLRGIGAAALIAVAAPRLRVDGLAGEHARRVHRHRLDGGERRHRPPRRPRLPRRPWRPRLRRDHHHRDLGLEHLARDRGRLDPDRSPSTTGRPTRRPARTSPSATSRSATTIGFRQTLEDDGSWTIDAIAVILPHVGGEVTAVDGSTITVEQRDGTSATITIGGDANIVVNGDAARRSPTSRSAWSWWPRAPRTPMAPSTRPASRRATPASGAMASAAAGSTARASAPGFGGGEKPDATAAPEATGSAT